MLTSRQYLDMLAAYRQAHRDLESMTSRLEDESVSVVAAGEGFVSRSARLIDQLNEACVALGSWIQDFESYAQVEHDGDQ